MASAGSSLSAAPRFERQAGAPGVLFALLGSSNLTIALPQALNHLVSRLSGTAMTVFVAHGPGRSYGVDTGSFGIKFRALSRCALLPAVEEAAKDNPAADTWALLTDIGNDIMHGVSVKHLMLRIRRTVERLRHLGATVGVTSLPVEGLAEMAAQNRTALVALTAMKSYDNYTFTHMVNVSILAMAQARALGLDGPQLREVGLSALMHDVGKVRVPAEILQKAERLTDEEFTLMKRHVVDGAEILRQTPEMPIMAPSVAFEHHLRLDGGGYPNVTRTSLNLATMLTSIADVYDAMRSQRAYQQAFPTDRILAVMQRNDGSQFDQNLVRRFVQLIGIYPPGTLVQLNTNEIAIVLQVHAPDPHRPRVQILRDPEGHPIPSQPTRHLWETADGDADDVHITKPLDPADYGIDPLDYL